MEILMKLKCSPTPAHSPHLLKNVDRLQQQQQQQRNSSPLQKLQQQQQQQMQQHMNYNATNINCCPQADYMQGRCCNAGSCCAPQIPACCTSGVARHAIVGTQMNYNNNNSTTNDDLNFEEHKFEYKEPEENFVSIDDIKIKSFLMKIGQEQRKKEAEQKKQEEAEKVKKINVNKKPAIVYEIIDLDDEEEREKLKRIKNQAVEDATTTTKSLLLNKNQFKNVNEDILQQVQQQQQQQQQQMRLRMQQKEQQQQQQQLARQSPNISLVPAQKTTQQQQKQKRREKQQEAEGKLRIIAEIDLLDSSDEDEYDDEDEPGQDEGNNVFQVMSDDEGNDALVPATTIDDDDEDDDDIPLAAAAVSCELECDDNDDYQQQQQQQQTKIKIKRNHNDNTHCVMASDEDNDDYVDEHEEGLVVRWDELELEQDQRNATTRNIYECFICGKRVQSNYNLRRHMMIHTGERPFGCDLCDRRFREFSDLKKHRRRHANDANFMCMVCQIKPPSECDPTRCETCDPKMGAVIALRQTNSEGASKASKIMSTVLQAKKKTLPPLTKMNATTASTAATTTKTTTTALTKATKLIQPTKTITLQKIKLPPSTTTTTTTTTTNQTNAVQQQQKTETNELPPLTPIRLSFEDQLIMLDTIPAVHRSVYTKGIGLVRRKEFPCPICQRAFGTRHNLKRHFMIHTGEKPFSCTRCRKPFREYSTLKKHMITHARERWYKCLRCPEKFLDYLDYTKHKQQHPEYLSGSGAEDASASSSASASAHNSPYKRARQDYRQDDSADSQDEDSSVAEDGLECCECGQRFTDLDNYTEHIKTHEAQMLYYECFVCKQTLSDLNTFEQHMKEVHGAIVQSDNEDDEDDDDIMHDNDPQNLLIVQVDGNKKR